ncbi:MAG: enoyl-CoA hydratase/isomerase family protein [Gemmatimonadota bacterium]|nr:MAG: enoyl-CoA hydratase/isomerase family protein [Gemmatimonadota bacterium]
MIHREDRGPVSILRIDHGKVGAIDTDLMGMLAVRLDEIESIDVKAVVLTGTGSSFSAGLDLKRILDGGEPYVRTLLAVVRRTITRLFTFPRPVVAALNGHAIAGGCVLACACDYRVMVDGRAKIGFPAFGVRMPYPSLGMEILKHVAPLVRLEELVYGGELYTPEQARGLGLVNEVAEPERLLRRAWDVAERLAAAQPLTFRLNKSRERERVVELAARDAAREEEVDRAWSAPEAHAAIRAHLEAVGSRD